ncbi:TonB-dependent receptor [Neisseria brasiliensis]|uniref:TonB-dependent receptor n=1 Tax=Neisseria TaxID=482 RepID=UPI000C2755A8|nr:MULTISPECIES: TonB-dependent receptor [Neisseria]PJO76999.1 ligand-gated channel [Neisseria sp. N177_16]QGL24750.1 TonB-dependent receptor [Neisseria brasiliensis]
MMQNSLKPIVFSLLLIGLNHAWADGGNDAVELETVDVVAKSRARVSSGLTHGLGVSDRIIDGSVFKQKAVNLGDALNGNPGIHANQYGGGASAPVIRGQGGRRIKVLHHHGETGDMADFSPDHALTVDTVLSKQVEILRGPVTLAYSSGNVAGLVDVADNKIPEKMPEAGGVDGELTARFGSGSLEKLYAGQADIGLGKHIVLHTEGLWRKSSDYAVPHYHDARGRLKRLPDSRADSQSGSVGLSWVGEGGFIGGAYSIRKDQYGLPAHSHLYDDCHADIIWQKSLINKRYLQLYPHLLTEEDVDYDNPGLSCGVHEEGDGHAHTHNGRPWIDLKSRRYDIRAELKQPLPGFDTLRLNIGHTDYRHQEKSGDTAENFFNNQTSNIRLELRHRPTGRLKGSWGIQYLTQKSSALSAVPESLRQPMLIDNQTKRYSLFGIEQLDWDDFQLEAGMRVEKQKAAIRYDLDLIERENYFNQPLPDLGAHRQTARSFALAGNWHFAPGHKFSLTASHQERLPSTQELYAHGKHVATNTFEVGNKHLQKERSNNLELGWGYEGSRWQYNISLYRNRFQNYIYAQTLNDGRGPKSIEDDSEMKLIRYNQSGADFYGAEGEIHYQAHPRLRIGLSGDYVKGRLKKLPTLPGREDAYGKRGHIVQADQNAPRVPAARVGVHFRFQPTEQLNATLDYYRLFTQNRTARYETPTPGHHMLNAAVHYRKPARHGEWYGFIRADNLLNQSAYAHSSFLSHTPQMGRSISIGAGWKF